MRRPQRTAFCADGSAGFSNGCPHTRQAGPVNNKNSNVAAMDITEIEERFAARGAGSQSTDSSQPG